MNPSPTSRDRLPTNAIRLDSRSRALRRAIVRVVEASRRGHIGSAFSLVEILRVLYDDVLRYDALHPRWPDRDRCIFSKGHGCLALYVILAEKGFFPAYELTRFCQDEGILGGHPEYGKIPGVEASTGSLGHGLSLAVGMALGARQAKASHRMFAVISDGECNEGSTWEAALCASKHRLANLTAVLDYNQQQSYATTHEVLELEPLAAKWSAFGWEVREVDGHDVEQLKGALRQVPFHPEKPSLLICHTIKGKGVSFVENDLQWHHKSKITDAEVGALLAELEG